MFTCVPIATTHCQHPLSIVELTHQSHTAYINRKQTTASYFKKTYAAGKDEVHGCISAVYHAH